MSSLTDGLKRFWSGLVQRRQRQVAAKNIQNQAGLDHRLVLKLADRRLPSWKQLGHLGRFLTPPEKNVIKALLTLIVITAIAVGGRYYSDHVTYEPATGGDYVEASVGSPHFVNPILASGNDADLDLASLVFSGLMRTNNLGRLEPDLATGYEISEDGKTYTFHLREGVVWQDGATLTANDVLATINYIKTPEWGSPFYSQFKSIGVEAPDEKTVIFTLKEPFAPFLSLLTLGILPEHLWVDIKPENATRADLNIKPVGTGPFKFKNLVKDKRGAIRSYTLARNEAYYGQKPYLDAITFKYYPDFGSAVDALLKKQVAGISYLPAESHAEVEKLRAVKTYALRLPQYTAVFFNQNRNASLKSKAVRQALALAINRNRLLDEAVPASAPAYGPIPPGFVGFHPDIKKYAFDAAAAASLLEQDGWKPGADGIRFKEVPGPKPKEIVQQPLAVTLTTVDAKENIAVAQIIKQDWRAIGVQTELEIVPASRISKDNIRPREYDALLYGEIIGPDSDPYPFWHSSQNAAPGLNLAIFAHRRADELLEKARLTTKDEERTGYYKEFQDILAEEAPAIFLYSPTYAYAVSREMKGIDTATIFAPSGRFVNVGNWYLSTKRVWK